MTSDRKRPFKEGDRVRFTLNGAEKTGRVVQTDVPVGPGLIFLVETSDSKKHLVGLREMTHED